MATEELTIKKFLLKKFPTHEYMDCPVPKHHWETIEEYAAEKSKKEAVEFADWLRHLDNGTTHYNPITKQETESIGFSPFDCFTDKLKTTEELWNVFHEQKQKP